MDLTQFPNLAASPQAREVVAAALTSGEAHIAWRDGVAWYSDPEFGEDVPVSALAYDPELGLYVQEDFDVG